MKKIFTIATFLLLAFQIESMSIDWYQKEHDCFSEDTDLINGYVLYASGLLKSVRFYGNIEYFFDQSKKRSVRSCSLDDKGKDFMSSLVIQFFPSPGESLNAQGSGSIEDSLKKIKEDTNNTSLDITDIIIMLLKIDISCRHSNGDADTKNLIESIKKEISLQKEIDAICNLPKTEQKTKRYKSELKSLRSREEKLSILIKKFIKVELGLKDTPKSLAKLVRLIENLVWAQTLERVEKVPSTNNRCYPPKFTNYLICAYAWNVITAEEQLRKLANKIKDIFPHDKTYQSQLLNRILKRSNEQPPIWPFGFGQPIIKNATIWCEDFSYHDCVETTLRQLFAILFCESQKSNEQFTGDKTVAINRIPNSEESKKLKDFFSANNIQNAANDNALRYTWASIVSDIPGINYCQNNCELDTGWINFIRIFCYLMKGYSAETNGANSDRSKLAEKYINKINAGHLNIAPEEIMKVLNVLLGIRSDIELIAIPIGDLKQINTGHGVDIIGTIRIFPKNLEQFGVKIENGQGHAQVFYDNKNASKNDTTGRELSENSSWIECLHINPNMAITGKERSDDNVYHYLSESIYPCLDCSRRLHDGVRRTSIVELVTEILIKNPLQTTAAVRLLLDEGKRYPVSLVVKKISENNKILQGSSEKFFELIAANAESPLDIITAISVLPPEKQEKFKKNNLDNLSLNELIVQKVIFRSQEADEFIINQINNNLQIDKNLLAEPISMLRDAINNETSLMLPAKVIDTITPYINSEIDKMRKGERIDIETAYLLLMILDITNFDENNLLVSTFINTLVEKGYSQVYNEYAVTPTSPALGKIIQKAINGSFEIKNG